MAYTILLNKIRIGGKAPTAIYKGGTEVKCVYKGSTLVYDTQKSSTITRKFSFSYASNYLPQDAGTTTPSITKGYNTTATGHSGATYDRGWTTAGGTPTFSLSTTSWASINSSTGALTYQRNDAAARTLTVTGKCTVEGTSITATQYLEQTGDPYTLKIYHYCYDNSFRSQGGYFFSEQSYYYSTNAIPGVWYPIREHGAIDTYSCGTNYPSFDIVDQWGATRPKPYYSQSIYVWVFKRDNYNYSQMTDIRLQGSIYWQPGSMNSYTFDLNILQ